MSCWWRKVAQANGLTAGSGSWKRRVATGFQGGLTLVGRGSWPRVLARSGATVFRQQNSSWTARMTPATDPNAPHGASWARILFDNGGPF